MLFSTDSAERKDTSCSGEMPPNRTQTLNFRTANASFLFCANFYLYTIRYEAAENKSKFFTGPFFLWNSAAAMV